MLQDKQAFNWNLVCRHIETIKLYIIKDNTISICQFKTATSKVTKILVLY